MNTTTKTATAQVFFDVLSSLLAIGGQRRVVEGTQLAQLRELAEKAISEGDTRRAEAYLRVHNVALNESKDQHLELLALYVFHRGDIFAWKRACGVLRPVQSGNEEADESLAKRCWLASLGATLDEHRQILSRLHAAIGGEELRFAPRTQQVIWVRASWDAHGNMVMEDLLRDESEDRVLMEVMVRKGRISAYIAMETLSSTPGVLDRVSTNGLGRLVNEQQLVEVNRVMGGVV
jgi:hypothetical protein